MARLEIRLKSWYLALGVAVVAAAITYQRARADTCYGASQKLVLVSVTEDDVPTSTAPYAGTVYLHSGGAAQVDITATPASSRTEFWREGYRVSTSAP